MEENCGIVHWLTEEEGKGSCGSCVRHNRKGDCQAAKSFLWLLTAVLGRLPSQCSGCDIWAMAGVWVFGVGERKKEGDAPLEKIRSEMFSARLTCSGHKAEYHRPVRHSGTPVFDTYLCHTTQDAAFRNGG